MKTIFIEKETLPTAWEDAVIKCWNDGDECVTQYDKPGDPPSKDCTVMIRVMDPLAEPRIHKAFPGGLDDLEKYRSEMLYGVHNHWCDAAAGKWSYTYNDRLFNYPSIDRGINQISQAIDMLKIAPHTRRAQAITWCPSIDPYVEDPACLQRIHLRIISNKLHMNVHMRSNDAFKAAFMNMYAFTELQKDIAERLGVGVGDYVHISDSFHIYGSYFELFKGFLDTVKNRTVEDRVWDTQFAMPMFIDGCMALLQERDMPEGPRNKVLERLCDLKNACSI